MFRNIFKSFFLLSLILTKGIFAWDELTLKRIEEHGLHPFKIAIDSIVDSSDRGFGEANFSFALALYEKADEIAMDFTEKYNKIKTETREIKENFINSYTFKSNKGYKEIKLGIQIINNNDINNIEKDALSFMKDRLRSPIELAQNLKDVFLIEEKLIVKSLFAHQKTLFRGILSANDLVSDVMSNGSLFEKLLHAEPLDSIYSNFDLSNPNAVNIVNGLKRKSIEFQLQYASILVSKNKQVLIKSLVASLMSEMYHLDKALSFRESCTQMIDNRDRLISIIKDSEYVDIFLKSADDYVKELEDLDL